MTEQRYTLDEARTELARQECAADGHNYDVISSRSFENPAGTPVDVRCARCKTHWPIAHPNDPKETP